MIIRRHTCGLCQSPQPITIDRTPWVADADDPESQPDGRTVAEHEVICETCLYILKQTLQTSVANGTLADAIGSYQMAFYRQLELAVDPDVRDVLGSSLDKIRMSELKGEREQRIVAALIKIGRPVIASFNPYDRQPDEPESQFLIFTLNEKNQICTEVADGEENMDYLISVLQSGVEDASSYTPDGEPIYH